VLTGLVVAVPGDGGAERPLMSALGEHAGSADGFLSPRALIEQSQFNWDAGQILVLLLDGRSI